MEPVFSLLSALCFLLLLRHQQMECCRLHHEGGIHTGIEQAAHPTTLHWTAPGQLATAWTGRMPGETREKRAEIISKNSEDRQYMQPFSEVLNNNQILSSVLQK